MWTPDKLTEYMQVFCISAQKINNDIGVPMTSIYRMRDGVQGFDIYGEELKEYFNIQVRNKEKQYQEKIDYYKSFSQP